MRAALTAVSGTEFDEAEVTFVYGLLRGGIDVAHGLDAVRGAIEAAAHLAPGPPASDCEAQFIHELLRLAFGGSCQSDMGANVPVPSY